MNTAIPCLNITTSPDKGKYQMNEVFENYVTNALEKIPSQRQIDCINFNYKKYFPENKNVEVLDIGVGIGEQMLCFRDWGYNNAVGIDISPETVEFCKKMDLNCIQVADTVEYLKANQNRFAVITMSNVIEHIPREQLVDMVKAIYGALTDGGVALISTPNMQAAEAHLHFFNDVTHLVGFSEHSFRQLFSACGINDVEFYGFECFPYKTLKFKFRRFLRALYWKKVKFARACNGILNPSIMHPIFFAIIKKR